VCDVHTHDAGVGDTMRIFLSAALLAFAAEANDAGPAPVTVPALRETAPVEVVPEPGKDGRIDAADDPAIVVGETPAETRIIGTNKKGGLYVYDLDGKVTQTAPGGLPNNVDMRDAFPWTEGVAPIVATSDRIDNTIAIYRFDPNTKTLDAKARVRIPTGFVEVYGITLGRLGSDFVVVATAKNGDVAQWTLTNEAGAMKATPTRSFTLGSIAEGCVVDDEAGLLYISQELVGLWRLPLDPARGGKKTLVDGVGPRGKLAADVEGVTIWRGPNGGGYLIVSAQGQSRFNVYDRGGANAYRGTFAVVGSADGAIDAVTTTDGLDASSAPLGPAFPRGILVVQDDINALPDAAQNFKYVSWAGVEAALGLNGTTAEPVSGAQ
jgi:3-phytase